MGPARQGERGITIAMAVLALTIISLLMLYIGTQTLNSMFTARKKQERSVGMAAGDSAVEKYRAALQAHLADEANGFQLDAAALRALVDQQPGADVVANGQTSVAAHLTPVRVPASSQFTVKEPGTDSIGWWQVYDVLPPRYASPAHGGTPSDLVVYIRAWATDKGGSGAVVTKPRIFRVEYRPGYFSDYESVTDAPFIVRDNPSYTINGPIHSNGYQITDWLTMGGGTTHRGIWFEKAPTCTPKARFSTSQGAPISVPGCPAAAGAQTSARQISLLGVQDAFDHMNRRCGAYVVCVTGAAPYDVVLGAGSVRVNGRSYGLVGGPDSGSLAVLLDGDVTVRGALSYQPGKAGRVTIATRRRTVTDRNPRVHLRGGGTVGGATRDLDTVGIISQGDVVLDGPAPAGPSYPCMSNINVAAIAQAGSVTVSPEFVTLAPPAVALGGRECSGAVRFHGAFAGHGQFLASIKWPDIVNGGVTPSVGYSNPALDYNDNLYLNPPPFFPAATPWSMTRVKDADTKCLIGPEAGNPACE
ncbi:MAG: hypothetical protein JWM98_469 [Thermoleophilia bacterium]|nr:hypothetical protein [Thermoleophilia bacterium]